MAFDRANLLRLRSRVGGLLRWSRSLRAVASLRAAWWALRAARQARGALATGKLEDISLPLVPRLPERAGFGVTAVLRHQRYTCLERAVVRQAWYAARGDRRDVVIGVRAPSTGFAAHAWLDGDGACDNQRFDELTRKPATGTRATPTWPTRGSSSSRRSPTGL